MTPEERNMIMPHVCTLGCQISPLDHGPKIEDTTLMTAAKANNIRSIVDEVLNEVMRATSMYQPLNSPHEAHSVIEEEFDEFWDEVKAYNLRKGRDTRPRMREELIQLAAMAVRAVTDVIDNGKPTGETLGNLIATPVQATTTIG